MSAQTHIHDDFLCNKTLNFTMLRIIAIIAGTYVPSKCCGNLLRCNLWQLLHITAGEFPSLGAWRECPAAIYL